MKIRWIIAASIVVSLSLSGCVDRAAQQQAKDTMKIVTNPVQTVAVQEVQEKTLTRDLEITGEVTTSSDSQVGAKTTGKVVSVNVKDGDHVRSGQVLAVLDTTPLVAQLNQANAGVLSAQATLATAESQLSQALSNATVNPNRSSYAVISARAALNASQENLNKMLAGARPQERRQADATLNSARANLNMQQKQLDRIRTLVTQGALAGSQLDQQEATYQGALATFQNAKEAVDMMAQGNRVEDINAARQQVAEARQSLKTAQASKSLDSLYLDQVAAAKAGVNSAKAGIENAKAQVVIARQSLSDAVIRAPFDGQVSGKPIDVGSIAGPGTTIVRIVGSQGIYFEGNVPSDSIGEVKVGLPVRVHVDAVAQATFAGKIAAISPMGSSVGRLFSVRVQFVGAPMQVKPGMFATGDIQVETVPNATVVPATAVMARGDTHFVFIAEKGKAKKTLVETGLQQGDLIQVKGIPVGTEVIVQGQDRLSDGVEIKTQKPVALAEPTETSNRTDQGQG